QRDGARGDGSGAPTARRLRLQPRISRRAPAPRGSRNGPRWRPTATAAQHDRRRADQARIPVLDLRTRSRFAPIARSARRGMPQAEPSGRGGKALRPLLLMLVPLALLACNPWSPGPAKTVETFLYAVDKGNLGEARKLCSGGAQGILRPVLDLWL